MKTKKVGSGSKATQAGRKPHERHSAEFKKQSLERAVLDGFAVTARDLGLAPSQLYSWRSQSLKASAVSEEERLQTAENARLRREVSRLEEELAFLKKAAAYFAKQPK
jgi:transposase